MAFIEMKDIVKTYGSSVVLHGVSLSMEKGQVVSIIGPSGAGKSTFLRCLNHLEIIQKGSICINGQYLARMDAEGNSVYAPEKEMRKICLNMGMVFQSFNLFPHMTVLENIMAAPVYVKGMTREEILPVAQRLLEKVGLWNKRDFYPGNLSGGQKQRVAIARALANDPEIILSDESTSALDPRTTRAILDLLKKVNRELGITIVVITHEMQVIKDICDRVAVMKDGRVVETGTVFDIFANPKEQITREFVENTSNMSRIYELVETKSPVVELKPGEAILRFRYLERNVSEALVSQLSRKFDLDLNIIFGSIELIGENPIGGLVVIAQGTSDNINQAIQYLKDKNVGVEVILDGRTA